MRKLILIFCGVFCCLTALHAKDPALYLYQVDALDKVFKDRRYFVDEIDTLAVARGEYATLQVVIKSNREIKGMWNLSPEEPERSRARRPVGSDM